VGIEPTHKGFADLSLTTWVPRLNPTSIAKFSDTCQRCPVSFLQQKRFVSFSSALHGQNQLRLRYFPSVLGGDENGHLRWPHSRKIKIILTSFLRRFLDLRFPQKPRGLFRRRGIDVKPSSPLESRHLRQFRNDLDVPVIVVVDLFPDG
jgi:hypothetical protein